jgi:hypothetical protein
VNDYGDWLPMTAIIVGYEEYLVRVLSFDDKRTANLILPNTSIHGTCDNMDRPTRVDANSVETSLSRYVFADNFGLVSLYGLSLFDFDTVHISMDVSRILTACTTLLAVSKECRKLLSEELDVSKYGRESLACFPDMQPLTVCTTQANRRIVCMPCRNSGGGFLFCQFVALREYLRSLVRFAADSSFATAPKLVSTRGDDKSQILERRLYCCGMG